MSYRVPFALNALLVVAFLVGCGESPPEFVPVEGVITINGKAKRGLFVRFNPDEAKGNLIKSTASGTADAQGKFKLQYEYQGTIGDGAAVGKYRVTVGDPTVGVTQQGQKPKPPTIPPIYGSLTGSPFEAEVKSGQPLTVEFDIKK